MENETGEMSPMEQKLDIFLRLPDGKPLWVESVLGYEKAKLKLKKLIQSTPGDYFLFNAKTGEIVGS
jgi:secreted protein with Ig-like and vWFA domain